MLDALRFHRYRAFDDWTELELRPLTVVFGYNNAGKSAAVRLLPGIAESVAERAASLYLGGQVFCGAGFAEISHHGGREVGFELRWPDDARGAVKCARWVVRSGLVDGGPAVDTLAVTPAEGAPFELRWADAGARFACFALVGADGGERDVGEVEFEGLVPRPGDDLPSAEAEVCRGLAQQMKELADGVRWIGGHRGAVDRIRPRSGARGRRIRFEAADAADVLAAAHGGRDGQAVMHATNLIYGEIGRPESPVSPYGEVDDAPPAPPMHALAVDFSLDGQYSLRLSRGGGASPYAPNIVDAGEGMTQVLPVAVSLAQIEAGGPGAPRLLCVEQPELHLHPRAKQVVAERIVEAAIRRPAHRLLVETHAHHMLLSIQVALAEGRLSPDQVLVYWARQTGKGDSRLERVELDALGRDADGRWPPGVFSDDAKMARRLIRARRTRDGSAR